MPVRVLWLTKGLGRGGAERLLVELAGAVDRDRVEPLSAYVLPWKDHLAGSLVAAGVPTTCVSSRRPDPRWPLALRRLLVDQQVAVVHAHSPVPAVVARLVRLTIPAERRPAIVTTEHNTWRSHHRLTRWANRWTGGADAATFAVTSEAAASTQGAAARRVQVLTHGIDVPAVADRSPEVVAAVRAELGIGPDELVIGNVANFRPQKDHANLLAAARRLADTGVAFRLVLVGQGPLRDEIVATVDRLGLGDHVVLAGYRPDALDVTAGFDVFTLSSAWEGLPVAVMEALALGRPIVATAVGGVAESLDDASAVLVPPGDPEALAAAWASVLADPARRAAMSAAARRLADRFDIHHAADALATCYEAVAPPTLRATSVVAPARDRARPARRSGGEDILVRRAQPEDRAATIDLLRRTLGWNDDERAETLYRWKHEASPFGPSYVWVALRDERVVAVRIFMRWRFRRGGATVDAVRTVDTATDADQRGRGLFRELTQAGLDQCLADGVALVFNTPNEQSLGANLTMGWAAIGRLPTAVRPTGPRALRTMVTNRIAADRWSEPLAMGEPVDDWLRAGGADRFPIPPVGAEDRTLTTDVDDRVRAWRYGLPDLHYRVLDGGDHAAIVRLRRRGAARELVIAERFGDQRAADRLAARVAGDVGATHALRLGPPDLQSGFVPLPGGGPVLTWRGLADQGQPPLTNWDLALRDIELF